MRHSQGQSDDYQNDLDFEASREEHYDRHKKLRDEFDSKNYESDKELLTIPKREGSKMLDQEFFDNIRDLTDELHRVNNNKFTTPVKVIEKKVEVKKPYSNRYRNFNPGLQERKTI